MRSPAISAACAIALVIGLAAPASAGCRKSITVREVPGGEPQKAQLIECDESETPALLDASAHLRLCDPKVLAQAGASFEHCAAAVDAAREGLRKAKIRAALRAGAEKGEITERYGASTQEVEAQRLSAELSGPIPIEPGASEEVAR